MVPGEGVEPSTCGLQGRCSTSELTRQKNYQLHVSAALPYCVAITHRLDAVAPALIGYGQIR